jgi:large subunit ribosomal protein L22
MREITAQLNGLRLAPRKVRLVANLVKRKHVEFALDQLAHMAKRAGLPLRKLLESAVANAEHNFKVNRSDLIVQSIMVDEGVKLHRFIPKGFGRANPIEKKTSRITVVLVEQAQPVTEKKAVSAAPKAPKKTRVAKKDIS